MDDQEYQFYADGLLQFVENYVETLKEDYDCQRTGTTLTIELFGEVNDNNKIVLNLQPFRHEVWLAGPSCAFHFRYKEGVWYDTRDAADFIQKFSFCLKSLRE